MAKETVRRRHTRGTTAALTARPPRLTPSLRALAPFRIGLVRRFVDSGQLLDDAEFEADRLLLICLTHELLDLGSTTAALLQGLAGWFEPLQRIRRTVAEVTGLPTLGVDDPDTLPPAPDLFTHAKSRRTLDELRPDADPFGRFRRSPDPFGVLGQALRRFAVTRGPDGMLVQVPRESRKDEGGYYTPFTVARRLAATRLSSVEEDVPAVLDPACGAGTFLTAAFDVLHQTMEKKRRANPDSGIEPVPWTVAALHGVDIDRLAVEATRLSIAVRAVLAEREAGGRLGQLGLFAQAPTFGKLIADRIRLGDSLLSAPTDSTAGTERLRLRLLARDAPGHLLEGSAERPILWDADFPLRYSDEEGAFQPNGGFQVILGNPPFVPVQRIPEERRRQLMASLECAQRRFDLFIGFVERAFTLLSPGGSATLIVPRTFLTERNAESCRRMLLARGRIDFIEELRGLDFDGAQVHCVAIGFSARRATDATPIRLKMAGSRKHHVVPTRMFRQAPGAMLRLEYADPTADECRRLKEASIPLGRYFCAAWGARGTPVREFHFEAQVHPLCRPMLKGDDVSPLSIRKSTRWLLYDVDRLYRPSRPEFFHPEKLVVSKVTGANGLVCAVDEKGHYTDDSLACVVRKADLASIPPAERRRHRISIAPWQIAPSREYDLHMIAALLQTPLVRTYYRVLLGGGLNVFPNLIEELPLPPPESLNRPEALKLGELGRKAARGEGFSEAKADRLARKLFGIP